MMVLPLVCAVAVLITLGYLALWSSSHEKTSKGLAGFGKVMAIILFVLGGLLLLTGITFSAKCCPMGGFMSKMHGGMTGHHKSGDMKMGKGMMKGQMMEGQGSYSIDMGECATGAKEGQK